MTDEPIVSLDGIEKTYGRVTVLSVPTIVLRSGDRVAISGENGSGKSTLLKILAGLTKISSGTETRRKDWSTLSVGFLPQDGGVYRDLSVRENVSVAQRMLGVNPDKEQVELLASEFGLASMMDKRVELLSGGYRRLAALFCLLSSRADLLFMDEPFASLDPTKQGSIEGALKRLNHRFQLIVISEHINNIPSADQVSFWKQHVQLESKDHVRVA